MTIRLNSLHLLPTSVLAISLGAPGIALAQMPAPAPSTDGTQLEDIVVTATRTAQSLQRVPVAVTAFSSEALERLQIHDVRDLSQVAPNVNITTVTGGSAGITPYIRGGGTTDGANITSEPEVGIYIDDVYQPRAAASFIEGLDIDRIEVLRGPQGTLYGRNSSAGALKIVTRTPGDEMNVKGEVGIGSWNEYYGKGAVSGPVTEDGRLRAGFSGIVQSRDGGRQYNQTLDKKVGAEKYEGFQSDLYYAGKNVKIRLKGFYSHLDSDGLFAVGLDPFATTTDYKAIQPASGSYRVVSSPSESFTNDRQYGTSLHVTADLAEHLELSSISAWSKLTDDWGLDFSGGVPFTALGIKAPGVAALFDRKSVSSQTSLSQEFQLHGSAFKDFITFVGGVYYFRESGEQTVDSLIFFVSTNARFGIITNSYAAFGQIGFHITPELTFTAGGRYTEDHKKLHATLNGVDVDRHDTFKDFLPKVSLDYQVTPQILTYASYSEGFKAGGYNGLAGSVAELTSPFAPQKVKAYEIGVKSEFFDRRLRLNVSAFINDYVGLQQQLVSDTGVFQTENYNARHRGIESELSLRLLPELTLWSNGVYNDGKYKAANSGDTVGTFVGNYMTNVFKYQATVGADLSMHAGSGKFVVGGNFSYRSDFFSSPDNSFYGHVPSTQIVDAYVGYELSRFSLRLAGKNLTDQRYWTTGFGFSVIRPRFLADPRTFRLSLSYRM